VFVHVMAISLKNLLCPFFTFVKQKLFVNIYEIGIFVYCDIEKRKLILALILFSIFFFLISFIFFFYFFYFYFFLFFLIFFSKNK
jgi:hypothetical protein